MSVKTNFWIDLTVFAGFLIALEPNMTGGLIHEWFALSLAGMLIVHFLLHWDWFIKLTIRFFENLYHSSRLNYLLAILIFVGFITIITSGLMISEDVMPFFGFEHLNSRGWYKIHELASNLILLLVAVHVAIRWEWVKTTIVRLFINPLSNRKNQTAPIEDKQA
jgi:cytochrome b